jgi:hypothetical protein
MILEAEKEIVGLFSLTKDLINDAGLNDDEEP